MTTSLRGKLSDVKQRAPDGREEGRRLVRSSPVFGSQTMRLFDCSLVNASEYKLEKEVRYSRLVCVVNHAFLSIPDFSRMLITPPILPTTDTAFLVAMLANRKKEKQVKIDGLLDQTIK